MLASLKWIPKCNRAIFHQMQPKEHIIKELINQAKKTKDISMSEIERRAKNTKGVFLENVDYNRIV